MKKLICLVFLVMLAASCSAIIYKVPSSDEQNHITTVTFSQSSSTKSITPSTTLTPNLSPILSTSNVPISSPTISFPSECGTTKFGIPGTQTVAEDLSILIQGTAILCNYGSLFTDEIPLKIIPLREALFDLDFGLANIESADIGFGVSGTMNFYSIVPVDNALASIWSLNGLTLEHPPQPTFDQCKQQVNPYNNDNEPEYVCVITNEWHISRVKLEKYNPVQRIPSVEISFITWKESANAP